MSLFTTSPRTSHSFSPFSLPSDFAPMFKLMDDYASHIAHRSPNTTSPSPTTTNHLFSNFGRSFTPKFDVKEENDRYILEGELPGIEQKDVKIEFVGDSQTLVVRGRTESVREERDGKLIEEGEQQQQQQGQITGEGESEHGYHKPTVQDEDAQMSGANPDANAAEEAESAVGEVSKQQPAVKKEPTSKYWISERSVGEFSRSFAFPARVDHENVKASLKNGVLSVVVPKAAQKGVRRIEIE